MERRSINIMILGPYCTEKGGVINFAMLLLRKLQEYGFMCNYHAVGQRHYFIYRVLAPFYFIVDILLFAYKLLRYKPHIVHLNSSFVYFAMIRDLIYAIVAKMMRKNVIFFIHGWNKQFYLILNKCRLIGKIFARLLNNMDIVVVLARRFAADLININTDEKIIRTFFIPIEYNRFANVGIAKCNKWRVLFLSNFFKKKGIYDVLNAIPYVIEAIGENIMCVLAGNGPEMPRVRNLIDKLNLISYVELPGFVTGERKYNVFKNSDIFVFPTSHGEGFPTVIAEAMAAGLPIIATPVGAIPEIIEHEVNGILISKPDPKEIAKAIIYLIENPDLRKKMGELNREKAKNFDISVFIKQLNEVYHKMVV